MTQRLARRVVLCADDYGLAPGIGVAIRDLLERKRISATSCMTAGPFWPAEAAKLRGLPGDLGLHFTLTDQPPAEPMPRLAPEGRLPALPHLVTMSFFGRLPLDEIEAELDRQLDRFEAEMGRPPDHLDGHQHVHALPGIRDVVLKVAQRRLPSSTYLRLTDPVHGRAGWRSRIIALLGHGLTRKRKASGGRSNLSFGGVRDFAEKVPYLDLLIQAISDAPPQGHLVMCHPGVVDDVLKGLDPVTHQREEEYETLKGEAFGRWLDERRIAIAPLV